MNCIVIAKLVGMLYLNNIQVSTNVYKLDCGYSEHYAIINKETKELKEVKILNINNDLSYNIERI